MKTGKLFVIVGPSGVGKGTVVEGLLRKKRHNLILSVSYTTRKRRPKEKDGVSYFFVTKTRFRSLIERHRFLEWAFHFDNYYGTSTDFVMENINNGKNVILEIDVIGLQQIKKHWPSSVGIAILPPNEDDLRKRLETRDKENSSEAEIENRLSHGMIEINSPLYKNCDHRIVNRNIASTIQKISKIIETEVSKED